MQHMYWRRPPRPRPKRDAPVPPAVAMMAQGFEDRPWLGTSSGEMLTATNVAPTPPAQPVGLHIPPPDWAEEERQRRELQGVDDSQVDQPANLTAHEEMMARALERGEIDEPGPPPIPMQPLPPLQRPTFPEPDWRQEQREREQAEAKERAKQQRHAKLLRILDEEGT